MRNKYIELCSSNNFFSILRVVLTSFILLLFISSDVLAEETVLILDAPDVEILPRNFRTTAFPFKDSTVAPSRAGLDPLGISGSGQFSFEQFDVMRRNLPNNLVVVDLRQEYHGYLNGVAGCWFSYRDAANKGLNSSQVTSGEAKVLAGVRNQKEITLGMSITKDKDGGFIVDKNSTIIPKTVFSEQELMASRGCGYLRIACTDHLRPPDSAVERFVYFMRELKPDVWVHFHCRAGKGRTTTFMLMFDMLRNAHMLNFETLAKRQNLIGGSDFTGKGSIETGWKKDINLERQEFLHRFYEYAKANPGGLPQSWLQWEQNN